MTLLKPFQQYHHDREMKNIIGISTTKKFFCRFSGDIDTAETITAVSMTPLKWFQRCQ
jgi:hypothetical protein